MIKAMIFTFRYQVSKTFIGGAVCPEFESEAPPAEEMLARVVCSREQFSFQMCFESGDGSGTFCNWRQRVPDNFCRWCYSYIKRHFAVNNAV